MKCRNKRCGAELVPGAVFCHVCGRRQDQPAHRAKSRGNGQGTVYQLPNGKWRAMKTVQYEIVPGTDKIHRKTVSRSDFAKKTDAVEFLSILGTEADMRNTKNKPIFRQTPVENKTSITLKGLYDLWLPTHSRSKSTMDCYSAGFRVFSDVWDVPMEEQDIDDLQNCIDSCELGKRTKQNAKTVLGLVYKFGIPRGYVPPNLAGEPNLAKFIRVLGEESEFKTGLSVEQLELIRKNIGKVPFADYVYCHCYLGFRPSAFIALTVESYNRDERAFVGGIKTAAGIDRTVTVSPKILQIVERLTNKPSGAVFCNPETGVRLDIKEYRAAFYSVLDACGIENPIRVVNGFICHKLTPHSCRHTFATLMKKVDAPLRDKLALIGHTDEKMLRHYQDVNYDDLRNITDAL